MDRVHGQEESAVSDDVVTGESGEQESRRPAAFQPVEAEPSKGGLALRIYKAGQGYYTRLGTAIGIGIVAVCGAYFLLDELGMLDLPVSYRLSVQYGVPASFLIVVGVLIYWLVGMARGPNDFFIATEGEMKKVSWSSRKDVVRSTKVVISSVLMLGAMLFVVDLAFMWFFHLLGVLKVFPDFARVFGLK